METINLNLSPRYVPNWGAWEVAREIICNAIDAAEDKMQCQVEGADKLIVTTPTVPDMGELFIIGEGSKTVGGNTIGQFGEGLKVAALAACRAPGGSLTLYVPGKRITFGFAPIFGKDVLHAYIEPDNHSDGYRAEIVMHGCAFAFVGRLLDDRTPRAMEKSCGTGFKCYVKGVFVSEFGNDAIWDWNLGNVRMNRDRSLVLEKDISEAIGIFFSLVSREAIRIMNSYPEYF